MILLEELIERNKKLLEEMKAHPDPGQMKSARIALEINSTAPGF